MAAVAVTAICGRRARLQSRVRAVPRGIWRLLVLLGLALAGCLLLGGTAYASDAPPPVATTPAPATPAAPAAGPAAPVLDRVLDTTDALVPALPVRDIVGSVTKPIASADVPADSTTVAEIPAAAAQAVDTAKAAPAAVHTLNTLGTTDLASQATKTAAAAKDVVRTPELPQLPHLTDIVAPVIADTTSQLRSAVDTTTGLVEAVAAPIPVVSSVTQQVGGTARDAAARTTSFVDATTYAATGGVDAIVDQATPVLAPVLQTLTVLAQLGAAGPSQATYGGVPSIPGYNGDIAGAPTTTATAPSGWADLLLTPQSDNGPGVPPPDAAASSTAQSASAIDTAIAVPVSDAGSTVTGSSSGSGTGSTGGSDLAKVLVERLSRRSAPSFAPKTEAPVRPMPGTPLADPGFSPD
jgi:hypothetical protein